MFLLKSEMLAQVVLNLSLTSLKTHIFGLDESPSSKWDATLNPNLFKRSKTKKDLAQVLLDS
jgi:hypothetical protein